MRLRAALFLFYLTLLLIPGYTVFKNTGDLSRFFAPEFQAGELTYFFLRLAGLYAFTLLFIQIMIGAFMDELRKLFTVRILHFHIAEGLITYGLALSHPMLFTISNFFTFGTFNPFYAILPNFSNLREFYLTFGRIGIVLLTIAVAAAILRTRPFFIDHWRKFHILNYLVFFLIFIHSFNVGSDTRTEPFIYLYPIFLIGVLISLVYRRIWRVLKTWK